MRPINKILKIGIIVLFLFSFQLVLASDLFYTGKIEIESLGANIDIDKEAKIEAVYSLINRGDKKEEVYLEFNQTSTQLEVDGQKITKPLEFESKERKLIHLSYSSQIQGEVTKNFCFDPHLLFNGKPNSKPAGSVLIKVFLPNGINKIITANQEFKEEGLENGRKFYLWNKSDFYPTTLCLKWSTLKIDLEVTKTVTPKEISEPNQKIDVEIVVKNKGDSTIKNVVLSDQYFLSDFQALQPLNEFKKEEEMLLWEKKIASLEAGESKTVSYSIKYIRLDPQTFEFELKPCLVTVNGHLASVSNTVRIKHSGKEISSQEWLEAAEKQITKRAYSPYLLVIIAIFIVLITVGVAYLVFKRKLKQKTPS
jgi:hypothetical protein